MDAEKKSAPVPQDALPAYSNPTAEQFLDWWFGDSEGLYGVSWKPSDGDKLRSRTAPTLPDVLRLARDVDAAGAESIYIRMTTLRREPEKGKRGERGDSFYMPGLWSDIDYGTVGHKDGPATSLPLPPDADSAFKVIEAAGLPEPSMVVNSGGGLYALWLFADSLELTDPDTAEELSEAWQHQLAAGATGLGYRYGTGVGDLARILRLPGSVNRKEPDQPRPCVVDDWDGPCYSVSDLTEALASAQDDTPPESGPSRRSRALTDEELEDLDLRRTLDPGPFDLLEQNSSFEEVLTDDGWTPCGQRHGSDIESCWTRPGYSRGGQKKQSCSAHVLTVNPHVLVCHSENAGLPTGGGQRLTLGRLLAHLHFGGDESEAARWVMRKYADPTTQKPHVNVTNLAEAGRWLGDEVGAGGLSGVFRRDGRLVHTPRVGEDGYQPPQVRRDKDGKPLATQDDDGPAQVRAINRSIDLAVMVDRAYDVTIRKKSKDGQVFDVSAPFPRDPAERIVRSVEVGMQHPNLRTLHGVVHTPTMRPDGSVLDQPGYDPATGLLYLPSAGLEVPTVPTTPTRADVDKAGGLLLEMLDGFPFVTPHDRANYLASLLSPLLRTLLAGQTDSLPPMLVIDAPQPGSGKSLLGSILRTLHGGVLRASVPGSDDEWEKVIGSILDATTGAVVQFDNVRGKLSSPKIEALTTSENLAVRRLGASEDMHLVNDRLWVVTANNLSIGGDLRRRLLWTSIDHGTDRPEEKKFAIADLPAWVRRRRGELLWALLTLIRAWTFAGRPMKTSRSDGFATWYATANGVLDLAYPDRSVVGTVGHQESAKHVESEEETEWGDFLEALEETFGTKSWYAKDIVARVDAGEFDAENLPGDLSQKWGYGKNISKSLGRYLMNRAGTVQRGLRVQRAAKTGSLWVVERTDEGLF